MRMLRYDEGGGRETTFSVGVALVSVFYPLSAGLSNPRLNFVSNTVTRGHYVTAITSYYSI